MLNFLKIGQAPTKQVAPPMDVAKNRPAQGVDLGAIASAPRISMEQLQKRVGAPPAAPAKPAALAVR